MPTIPMEITLGSPCPYRQLGEAHAIDHELHRCPLAAPARAYNAYSLSWMTILYAPARQFS